MLPDASKAAEAILARYDGKDPNAPVEEPEIDPTEAGLDSASEEAMAAFENKDPQALKVALRSFFDICSSASQPEIPLED